MRNHHAGITLLELLVTLAIVAITLAWSTPALRDYLLDLRMRAAISSLHADLRYARSQAVFEGVHVIACPRATPTATQCAAHANWHEGWLVFHDSNGDRQRQPGEPVVRDAPALESVEARSAIARRRLRFLPSGTAPGSNTTIRFCDARGAAKTRALALSNTGRMRRLTTAQTPPPKCT